MSGFEMFCERCGKRYGSGEATAAGSPKLAKRLLRAVGISSSTPPQPSDEPFLRFCLACRGYSCPSCWNEEAGFCQTCVPSPEPVVEHVHEPTFEAPPAMAFAPIELTASALAFGQVDLPTLETPPAVEAATAEATVPWAAESAIPWAPESQVPWATETPAVPWSTDPTLAVPDVDQAPSDFPVAPEVTLPPAAPLNATQFEAAEAEAAEAYAVDGQGVEPQAAEDETPDQEAVEPVIPAMTFDEPVPAAPFIAFGGDDETPAVDYEPLAVVVAESETVADAYIAEVETLAAEQEVEFEAEFEAVATEADVAEVEFVAADAEAVAKAVTAAEADAEEAAVEAEADTEAVPSLAMGERPLELVAAEVEEFEEPEPDVVWEWEELPVDEPVAAAVEEHAVVSLAAEEAVDVPVAEPVAEPAAEPVAAEAEPVMPPPVFRPLPPLGPIVPPPPPAPSMPVPRMEFELPDAPPAYVIAPTQVPQMRVLPTGLFDGPGPAIRPCAHCDLPVSAKARFCRRCGSAQEPVSPS
jgi:hypothetical protein